MNNIIISKATPNGISAICVIKITGENSNIFIKPLIKIELPIQRVKYTKIFDIKEKLIDYAIVLFFKAPKSFTGEDLVEFHIHGSEIIYEKIINNLILLGARMAKPGEFLERRYLNGKISLIECELINNKIYYNYESMFKLTIDSQKDIFECITKNSKFRVNSLLICLKINNFNNKEPIFKDFIFIKKFLKKFEKLLIILKSKFKKMIYLKKKYEIMIIGKRNVGKSTLFNKICMQYDSIVTNIPGTTKNTIKKNINIYYKKIIINDTTGLKLKTKNLIEKIGIIKNINNLYKGNFILYLINEFNLKNIFYNIPINLYKKIKKNELIIIINKCDLLGKNEGIFKLKNIIIILLSAKHSLIISKIKCFFSKIIDNEEILYNNEVNYNNISVLFKNCSFFYKEFCCNYDIIISKLINFQKKIYKMVGNYTNNELRNSIFRNFCLGK